jgi:CRP-like cAMP-binding protein
LEDYNTDVAEPDELLERHPLFALLDPDQCRKIARVGELESFEAGELVVAEGTPGDALYLVLSGTVTVVKKQRLLATLAAGEFFGEMSLVEPAPRSASVIAADSAFLFRLPYFEFQNMLESDPRAFTSVFVTIVRVLSERLRRSNELLGSIDELADWLAGSLV